MSNELILDLSDVMRYSSYVISDV